MISSPKLYMITAIILVAIILVSIVLYLALTPASPTPIPTLSPTPIPTQMMPEEKIRLTVGTATPGSVGYIAHSVMAELMTKLYPQYFEFSVVSIGGAAIAHAAWEAGKVDLGYSALNIVYQYMSRTGRYAPDKLQPQRTDEMTVIIYQYPLIYTIFVTEDLAGKVKCWRDIKDLKMPVYPTPSGYASHEIFREVFSILYDVQPTELDMLMKLVDMDVSGVPDALALGLIKIVWGYGDPGGPAPWLADSLTRINYRMVAIPPCPDEIEKILVKTGAVIPYPLDLKPYNVKTADGKTFIEKTIAMPFGLIGSRNLSTPHIYLLFRAHFEYCEIFEKTLTTFNGFCQWGLQLNIEAFKIQSRYGVHIHSGTALYLEEKGYNLESLGILVAK